MSGTRVIVLCIMCGARWPCGAGAPRDYMCRGLSVYHQPRRRYLTGRRVWGGPGVLRAAVVVGPPDE